MKEKLFSRGAVNILKIPNLIENQLASYEWFFNYGLRELLDEINPIRDHTERGFELYFGDYWLEEPKHTEQTAKEHNDTYEAPLRCRVKLIIKETGEHKEQDVFLGTFPIMTPRGTFVLNGVERAIVSQLIRSPGVFFAMRWWRNKKIFSAKVIPNRGAWLEFEADTTGTIWAKIDRKRKVPATVLVKAFSLIDKKAKKPINTNSEILEIFKKTRRDVSEDSIALTLEKDQTKSAGEAFVEIYKRFRPGEPATEDNAQSLIKAMFDFERYDLGRVGRWKFDQRLRKQKNTKEYREKIEDPQKRTLSFEDIVLVLEEIMRLNNDVAAEPDDIDNLSNRRVRGVGELLQNRVRVGMARMKRIIQDRMSTLEVTSLTPVQLINIRPLSSVVREFFIQSQLSQFMDQVNPLAELEHKRRISAMGPGGLTRERAGFEVRDVHPSHYGRLCPIQTPEGPNIGLVNHLSLFAKLNEFGFMETPYFIVKDGRVTDKMVYLDAREESQATIASADEPLDKEGRFVRTKVAARIKGEPGLAPPHRVQYVDVSPNQAFSVSTSLVPFLEHDDANRALMGSNMQRQAVCCIKPSAPLVSTGIEQKVAVDSGMVLLAEEDGEVARVDAQTIEVKNKNGKRKTYQLLNFKRSNQYTTIHQKPLVSVGLKVRKGDVIADGPAMDNGRLALGQNLTVAFMSWEGYNFEDAIIISERVLHDDAFSSIHIEDFSVDARETKLGAETTTPDIPNVGEDKLRDLDEEGIVRIGAEVKQGDILVGKISPKGETDLSPEERLLRAIFGEKARDVKDTSLRLPHGKKGRVVGVRIFSPDQGDRLEPGVLKKVQVEVAEFRRIEVGDKLAGRHGNKGVIAKILPEEDMPFLDDGTPVDIILNPLGIASRMNIGQILESHLGIAASRLGYRAITPVFIGANEEMIKNELKKAGLPEDGKITLHDGRTGEQFNQKVSVGVIYMMKLNHLVEDKIHMRSIGPYSLITQQPLGGKSQFGGQRFGEMEVWALEGYGSAYSLQEMLTIKSDDVVGRAEAYESIIRGTDIKSPHLPASFNVLLNELKGLGFNVDFLGAKKGNVRDGKENIEEIKELPKESVQKNDEVQKDSASSKKTKKATAKNKA